MACIIWQMPNGKEFKVPENEAHTPPMGAVNTGRIDWECAKGDVDSDMYRGMMAQHGVQWGSAVKWVASRIGIKQCSACKAREEILNHVKEHGWAETIRQLKETY